jgi:hypothetical protein
MMGVVAAGTVASSAGVASADSGSQSPQPGGSTVIVTPLLQVLQFGDTVGLPLACSASSVAATQSAAAPVVAQVLSECQTVSTQGDGALQQAITASQGLTFINPVVNPAVSGLASEFQNTGDNYGPSLSPLGPTIGGLGDTILFFRGM